MRIGRTSVSFRGSGASTGQSRFSGFDASGRWSGTGIANRCLSDTGPESPDGATSESSALLPSPMAGTNRKSRKAMTASTNNGRRSGGGNSSPPGLEQVAEILSGRVPAEMEGIPLPPATTALLPTPTADQPGGTAAMHLARKARMPDGARRTSVTDLRMCLEELAVKMLPTPRAHENGQNRNFPERGYALSALVPILSAEGSPASQSPPPVVARPKRTTAGSGPSSPVWLASYDRASSSWRTSEGSFPPVNHEGRLSAKSSERWPTWGTTRGGELYALPTPEPATVASGSFSLLPTTRASIHGLAKPRTYDGKRTNRARLEDEIAKPPTPTSRDWKDGRNPSAEAPTNGLLGRVIPRLGDSTSPRSSDGSE